MSSSSTTICTSPSTSSTDILYSGTYTFYSDIDLNANINSDSSQPNNLNAYTSPILSLFLNQQTTGTSSNPSSLQWGTCQSITSVGSCQNVNGASANCTVSSNNSIPDIPAFSVYGNANVSSTTQVNTDWVSNPIYGTSCANCGCPWSGCSLYGGQYMGTSTTVATGYSNGTLGSDTIFPLIASNCVLRGASNITSQSWYSNCFSSVQNCGCACSGSATCDSKVPPSQQGVFIGQWNCWVPNLGSNTITACIYQDGILCPSQIKFNPTAGSYPQVLSTSNLFVTYAITYNISFPSTILEAQNIINIITFYDNYSLSSGTQNNNVGVATSLIKDFCNYNNANLSQVDNLCAFTEGTFYFTSGSNPLQNLSAVTFCQPTSTGCQSGWLKYCNQADTIGTSDCYSFFSNSYASGTLDANVQTFLANTCVDLFVDQANGTPNDTFLSATDFTQNVCGCFFSNSLCNVYPTYVNSLVQAGLNEIAVEGIQCYYPYCANNGLQPVQPGLTCSNLEITQCYTENITNLTAGDNVNNNEVLNNVAVTCGYTSSNSSPTANYTPASPASPASTASTASPTTATTPLSLSSLQSIWEKHKTMFMILLAIAVVIIILIVVAIVVHLKKKAKK